MSGTRAISTTSRRELSSSFFPPPPARQDAEGNSRHSDRNITLFHFLVGLRTYYHPCTRVSSLNPNSPSHRNLFDRSVTSPPHVIARPPSSHCAFFPQGQFQHEFKKKMLFFNFILHYKNAYLELRDFKLR